MKIFFRLTHFNQIYLHAKEKCCTFVVGKQRRRASVIIVVNGEA